MVRLQTQVIGMEISHGGIAGVVVQPQAAGCKLLRSSRVSLPLGCLNNDLKEPQVVQPVAFADAAREAWSTLQVKSRRIALSLPDSACHLLLTRLDTPWKRRDEALELLRWKLGKRLDIDPELLQLDFQLFERHQDGTSDLLVALTHRNVILQYEELLLEAGLQPGRIGCHSLHLLQLCARFTAGAGQLVTLYDNVLATFFHNDGRLLFCRSKLLPDGPDIAERLRRELMATLAAGRQTGNGTLPDACHVMAPPEETGLISLLTAMTGAAPHQIALDEIIRQPADLSADANGMYRLSAAVGAAQGGC